MRALLLIALLALSGCESVWCHCWSNGSVKESGQSNYESCRASCESLAI